MVIRQRWVDVGRATVARSCSIGGLNRQSRETCAGFLTAPMGPINAWELWCSWIGLLDRAHHSTNTDRCMPQASEPSRLTIWFFSTCRSPISRRPLVLSRERYLDLASAISAPSIEIKTQAA
jgi:hypothetical protein